MVRKFAFLAGALALAFVAERARAADKGEEERNRALVAGKFEAWAAGTGGPYDLLDTGAMWTITGNSLASKTYPSREAFLAEVIRPFNARMKERLIPTVHHIYTDGDTVIIHFDARGVATDNVVYQNTYAWILQIRGGKIIRSWAWFDSKAFDDLWMRLQPG